MRSIYLFAILIVTMSNAFAIPPFDDDGGCSGVQYKWAIAPSLEIDATPFAGKSAYTLTIPSMQYYIDRGGNYSLSLNGVKVDLDQVGDTINYKIYGGFTNNQNGHSAWSGPSVVLLYPKQAGSKQAIAFQIQFTGKGGNGQSAPLKPVSGSIKGDLSQIKTFVVSGGNPHDNLALDDDSLSTCRATRALEGGWSCDGSGCHGPGTLGTGTRPIWSFP